VSVIAAPRSGSAAGRLVWLVLAVFRVMLGVLFLSTWASNLDKGLYNDGPYAALIRFYADTGDAPGIWKSIMRGVADGAAFFSKAQLVTELVFGIALVLGLATRVVGFAAGLFLSSLWLSELGVPNEWGWSLVFPALTALAVSLLSAGRVLGLDALLLDRRPVTRLPRWARG
jgi:uncharacterized membrane protein YphA (DoxX/SURF4 family)